jgi:DNA-binding NarL/FixJ family response regulator
VSLLLCGATNQLIAERRSTSRHTTANQVQSIFRKFGVRSRIELATALQTPGLPLG